MTLTASTYGNVIVAAPTGHIDHTAADGFEEALRPYVEHCANSNDFLVLDLSQVEYMSSAGLRVLMAADRKLGKRKDAIAVAAMQPDMREIFEISRFHMIFKTFDSVRDALEALSQDALLAFESA